MVRLPKDCLKCVTVHHREEEEEEEAEDEEEEEGVTCGDHM
jgi:hypothetical protein